MFKVNSFLGCVPLRWGVLLIGLLGLALQFSPIIILDLTGGSHLSFNYIDAYELVLDNFIRSNFYFGIFLWALVIVGILVNVILIAGVLKKWPKFFLPYIIFSWGQLVFVIIYITHKFLSGRILGDLGLILELVTPLVTIYFIICVYSYYVDVKKQKEIKETVVSVVLPTTA